MMPDMLRDVWELTKLAGKGLRKVFKKVTRRA